MNGLEAGVKWTVKALSHIYIYEKDMRKEWHDSPADDKYSQLRSDGIGC